MPRELVIRGESCFSRQSVSRRVERAKIRQGKIPGCADLVILPDSVVFCEESQQLALRQLRRSEKAYFESVYSVARLVQRVHQMHGDGQRKKRGADVCVSLSTLIPDFAEYSTIAYLPAAGLAYHAFLSCVRSQDALWPLARCSTVFDTWYYDSIHRDVLHPGMEYGMTEGIFSSGQFLAICAKVDAF